MFNELLLLCRNANGEIQTAAREAVLCIDVSALVIVCLLLFLLHNSFSTPVVVCFYEFLINLFCCTEQCAWKSLWEHLVVHSEPA